MKIVTIIYKGEATQYEYEPVESAQERIKKAEEDAIANIVDTTQSVGTGKYLREGAFGLGTRRGVAALEGDLNELSRTQFFVASQDELPTEWGQTEQIGGLVVNRGHRPLALFFRNNPNLYVSHRSSAAWTQPYLLQTEYNTRTDKNNVLHSGTGTPINTLNVSDMSDTVVDRDDVTVTSGAVYRALDELRAEIALLKGKLNE